MKVVFLLTILPFLSANYRTLNLRWKSKVDRAAGLARQRFGVRERNLSSWPHSIFDNLYTVGNPLFSSLLGRLRQPKGKVRGG